MFNLVYHTITWCQLASAEVFCCSIEDASLRSVCRYPSHSDSRWFHTLIPSNLIECLFFILFIRELPLFLIYCCPVGIELSATSDVANVTWLSNNYSQYSVVDYRLESHPVKRCHFPSMYKSLDPHLDQCLSLCRFINKLKIMLGKTVTNIVTYDMRLENDSHMVHVSLHCHSATLCHMGDLLVSCMP